MLLLLVYEWHQRLRLQWVVRCFSTRPAKFMFAPVQGADPKELKSLLMKVKEERGKAGSKLNIQKTKIMASSPITSWQMGKQWKQWQILFSWAPKSILKEINPEYSL